MIMNLKWKLVVIYTVGPSFPLLCLSEVYLWQYCWGYDCPFWQRSFDSPSLIKYILHGVRWCCLKIHSVPSPFLETLWSGNLRACLVAVISHFPRDVIRLQSSVGLFLLVMKLRTLATKIPFLLWSSAIIHSQSFLTWWILCYDSTSKVRS